MRSLKLSFFIIILSINSLLAQDMLIPINKKLYDPTSDAKVEISNAVKKAKKEGKHVFLQIGGNWCGWCLAFDKKVKSNDTLRKALEKNFVVYHVNFSKENKNLDILASLGYPQRFGFPVFVILDGQGNRLHTQNSTNLEIGKGHSTQKTLNFFNNWSQSAIDPKNNDKW